MSAFGPVLKAGRSLPTWLRTLTKPSPITTIRVGMPNSKDPSPWRTTAFLISGLVLCLSFGFLAGAFHHAVNVAPFSIAAKQVPGRTDPGQQRRQSSGSSNSNAGSTSSSRSSLRTGGQERSDPEPQPVEVEPLKNFVQVAKPVVIQATTVLAQANLDQEVHDPAQAPTDKTAAPAQDVQNPVSVAAPEKGKGPVQEIHNPVQAAAPGTDKTAGSAQATQKPGQVAAPGKGKAPKLAQEGQVPVALQQPLQVCTETCKTAKNGHCDDGRHKVDPGQVQDVTCDLGTDCQDVSTHSEISVTNTRAGRHLRPGDRLPSREFSMGDPCA